MNSPLPPFERAAVLVIGDVMLDRYYDGPVARISPEAPVPVLRVEQVTDRPGGAGNVALNLAALGARVRLAGTIGDDAPADALSQLLVAAGIDCRLHRLANTATVTKLRVISRHQQLLRLDFEDAAPAASRAWPQTDLLALLDGCDALVLSDYAKGTLAAPAGLVAAARARDIPVLVDPKGADFNKWRGATLLTPNLQEFQAVVGHCDSEAELVARGAVLMTELELSALLITRGEHGMTLLRPGLEAWHLPARAREVFDVTGAGDTVVAVLAGALAAGAVLPEAVALANTAAGVVVGKSGTAVVSAHELGRAVQPEPERGVLVREQLLSAVQAARGRGERLVFTNGCFDLLHAGHVAYLEQARALGDRLIVAVNSDSSVRRLKGAGRPINPQERRMAVLAALEAVDWVLCFDEDTPEALLAVLKPDVLVKGGDYSRREDVVGWDIVAGYGGEVCLMGVVDALSTSALVRQIRGEGED